MELNYVPLTKDNVFEMTRAQMKIFPTECGFFQYNYAVTCNKDYWKYWIVYNEENIVAITGLYSDFDISDTNSIWLGWFGVSPEYRKQGIGKKVLEFTINEAYKLAEKYPIKFFRLYTSDTENKEAQFLYSKLMDKKEIYNHPDDYNYDNTCLIWTKSLFKDSIKDWNNKYLGLKEIVKQEEIYRKIFFEKNESN